MICRVPDPNTTQREEVTPMHREQTSIQPTADVARMRRAADPGSVTSDGVTRLLPSLAAPFQLAIDTEEKT